mmetsp:Transcript_43097/g.105888  ORF Transcript_43097/g.105888 Transcript_43097/m.105888 type:complete len:109 (-) Transcript_43097:84-410(-)|eukprot:CAMPEP_0198307248 /NCGR_PEP_ID=MMETSP1450-20131203/160_1 /TAXON_ID=753684 ORGANISM="Madagascaria erythrocladiodes, Strain CCMP3234" /NCGR_SAMPLE_ID=MMETSP1450 /ASSEMBLY_ACC=CAM_ASM_001115 /LENGTH=108 /DNA_ID=CAMNT_0044009813 /DNA_START=78 /DNA_END=404 /DNA_ORIENTATION=+
MDALEPSPVACEVKSAIETKAASHCAKYKRAYERCVNNISSLDKLPDDVLIEKCEYNGVSTKDFNGVPLPRHELLEAIKPKANCIGQYFDYFHCVDHSAAPLISKAFK